jgi:hypothetical protein
MSDLDGDVVVLWSERQAELLRRIAPSMRQRRDLAGVCPVTLDDLLGKP